MTYALRDPYGNPVWFSAETPKDKAQAYLNSQFGIDEAPAKAPSRNPLRDVPGSLVSGIGSLVKTPGQIGMLLGADPDNISIRAGQAVQDFGQGLKSEGLRQQESKMQLALQEAQKQGLGAEAVEAVKQYLTNPYVLFNTAVESIPSLVAAFAGGAGAQVAAKGLGVATQAGLRGAGIAGASAAAGMQQGADTGDATYQRVLQEAKSQGMSDLDAQDLALAKARRAAMTSGAVTAASTAMLPGAERALFGDVAGKTAARAGVRSGLGEMAQEAVESGMGKFAENAESIDPNAQLLQGVPSAAIQGALPGGLLGGAIGMRERGKELRGERLEEQRKAAEKAKADAAERERLANDPQTLVQLDDQFQQSKQRLKDIAAEIKAAGKPSKDDFEAQSRLDALHKERKALLPQLQELAAKVNPKRGLIDKAREQQRVQGMDPQDVMLEHLGIPKPQPLTEPAQGGMSMLDVDQANAAAPEAVGENSPDPVRELLRRFADPGDVYSTEITGGDLLDSVNGQELAKLVATHEPALGAKIISGEYRIPGMTEGVQRLIGQAIAKEGKLQRSRYDQAFADATTDVELDRERRTARQQAQQSEDSADKSLASVEGPTPDRWASLRKMEQQLAELRSKLDEVSTKALTNKDGSLTLAGRQAADLEARRDETARRIAELQRDAEREVKRQPPVKVQTDDTERALQRAFPDAMEGVESREDLYDVVQQREERRRQALRDFAAAIEQRNRSTLVTKDKKQALGQEADRARSELVYQTLQQIDDLREASGRERLSSTERTAVAQQLGNSIARMMNVRTGQSVKPEIGDAKQSREAAEASLRTVRAKLRELQEPSQADLERRSLGSGKAFNFSETEQLVRTLKQQEQALMRRLELPTGAAMIDRRLQRLVDFYTVKSAPKVANLQDISSEGAQELERRRNKRAEQQAIWGPKPAESTEDVDRQVQFMRQAEVERIVNASGNPQFDFKTRAQLKQQAAALREQLNAPITDAERQAAQSEQAAMAGRGADSLMGSPTSGTPDLLYDAAAREANAQGERVDSLPKRSKARAGAVTDAIRAQEDLRAVQDETVVPLNRRPAQEKIEAAAPPDTTVQPAPAGGETTDGAAPSRREEIKRNLAEAERLRKGIQGSLDKRTGLIDAYRDIETAREQLVKANQELRTADEETDRRGVTGRLEKARAAHKAATEHLNERLLHAEALQESIAKNDKQLQRLENRQKQVLLKNAPKPAPKAAEPAAVSKARAELDRAEELYQRSVEKAQREQRFLEQPADRKVKGSYGSEYAGEEAGRLQTEAATEAAIAKRAASGRRDPQVSKKTLEEGTDPKKSEAMLRVAERIGARETDVTPQTTRQKLRTGEQGVPKKKRGEVISSDEFGDGDGTSDFSYDSGERGQNLFRQADTPIAAPLDPQEARGLVNAFLAKAPKALQELVTYYGSARELPAKYRNAMTEGGVDPSNVQGAVMFDGRIILVGANHASLADLEQTIAHEIAAHYGLRKLLGNKGLAVLTQRLMAQGGIGELAQALGVYDSVLQAYRDSKAAGETEDQANMRAVDEMLAHVEERRPSEALVEKAARLWKELAGLVRAMLRKLGLKSVAELNDKDMMYLLARARRAAMSSKGVTISPSGRTVFRTGKAVYAPGYEEYAGVADKLIARQKSAMDTIKSDALGLSLRTRFLDAYAPLEKLAAGMSDKLRATQMMFNLRMYNQRNHFVAEALSTGPVQLKKLERKDGRNEFVVETGEGASMAELVKLLPKGLGNEHATNNLASLYAIGKRAQRVGWPSVNLSMTADEQALADKLAKDPDSPFKAWHEKYQEFNKGLIDFAVQTGAISKQLASELSGTKDYVPFYRQTDQGDIVLDMGSERSIKVGNLKDQPYLHELKGGDERILDWFTGSVRNAALLTDMSLRNLATRDTAFALESIGAGQFAKKAVSGPNVIRFKRDGEEQAFVVDSEEFGVPTEMLVMGLSGVPSNLPMLVKAMGIPANLLRRFVTRNPVYMGRQLVRDPLNAWLTSGANFTPIANAVKEVAKGLTGHADKTLQKRGVVGGQVFSGDFHDLERLAADLRSGKTGWATAMAKLDAAAVEADAATRRSVYNSLIEQGLSEMEATLGSLETMNFNRRGVSASVRYANHLIPFLSATIQGWDVLYRTARGQMPFSDHLNTRRKLLMRGAMLAGMTMLYALAMEDDEAYKNANDMERLSNWFVRIPGFDEPIKVPIPFELGLVFKALPEMLVNSQTGFRGDDQNLTAFKDLVMNMVPNVFAPQGVKPLIEAYMNRSFFSGRDIENPGLQKLDIGKRADDRTTETAKLLGFDVNLFGQQYGVSPKMLEHIVSQYTGGMGLAIMALTDTLLPSPAVERATRSLAEAPITSGLFQRNNAGGDVNRLYKQLDAIQRYKATYDKLLQTSPAEAAEYLHDNGSKVAMGKAANKAEAALQKFTEAENNIRRSAMDPDRKRAALDQIKARKAVVAQQYATMFGR